MVSSRRNFTQWFLLTAIVLSPAYTTVPALGQELEEIIVTARKRLETLQDVPISVTAFTESQIESAGIQRPADFISKIPNITIVDTANVGDTQVSIRGIVSTRDAESTFAYVVDGVLTTNPNSFNEELLDVAQIEVLKGPQGALYGRNAVAGAVLVTTKEPGDEFEGRLRAGAGNNSSTNYSAILSGPLGGSARGRIAASYRETDGHYTNVYEGVSHRVDYLEDTSVKARLMFDIGDNFSLDFRGGASEVEGGAINFNAVFAIPNFVGLLGPNAMGDVNQHNFIYAFNVPGENEQETVDFSIKADWAFNNMDLTATVAYNNLDEFLLSDGTSATFYGYELTPACLADRAALNNAPSAFVPGGADRTDLFGPFFQPFGLFPPGPGLFPPDNVFDFEGVYGPYTPTACDGYQYQERNQEDLSFELRLTSAEDQALRWIAGIYVADIEREVVVTYGADQGQGFLRQPYVDPTGPNPTDLMFHDIFDTQVFAAFGQVEYDISDNVELAVALRYDTEDREVHNQVPNVTASGLNLNTLGPTFLPGPINPAFIANPSGIPSRSRDFSQLQPKVSLSWRANDTTNLYVTYGVGFRSGGFNSLGSEALLNLWFNDLGDPTLPGAAVDAGLIIKDEYDKEVTDSIELGAKFVLADNRVHINAAFFYNSIEDNQFFEFFAGPFGLLRVVTTIEEVEMKGFELDFNALVTENLSIFGGVGLLDSEIKQNLNRPLSVGNNAPQAPEETRNFGAELNYPLDGGLNLTIRADWQYVGEMWFHTMQGQETPTIWNVFFGPAFGNIFDSNFRNAKRDAFDTIDARVTISGEHWDLALWGRNIGNERYLEEIIPAPEFGGSFIHEAPGDSFGAEFTYRF